MTNANQGAFRCAHAPYMSAAIAIAASITLAFLPSLAQETKPDETPRVLMCVPLGMLPGETTKLTARGFKLEGATEVKTSDAHVTAKLTSQGKANVPNNQNVQKVGDNQVEFELVVPADFTPGNLELTFVTPKGEAKYALPIGGDVPAVVEKEPNPGFKQPQAISLPQIVIGRVENPHDVDVYSIDVQAGQKIVVEASAQRLGSGLDAMLTVHDPTGQIVASHDDLPDSSDAQLEFIAASAGKYSVVLQDAHDQGGPAHPYRLIIRLQ